MYYSGVIEYQITVWTRNKELVQMETLRTAPQMEDRVGELHREYPAPHFWAEVENVERHHH
jgi:hypothetical protein